MNVDPKRRDIDEAYDLADALLDHLAVQDGEAAAATFESFRTKFKSLGEMLDFSSPALGDTDFGAYDGSFAFCYLSAASAPVKGIDRSRNMLHKVKRRLNRERWQLIRDHCGGSSDTGDYVRMTKMELSLQMDRTFRTLKDRSKRGKFRMTEIEGTHDVWVHKDEL